MINQILINAGDLGDILDDVEIDGIDRSDYPDLCDAYISSACFKDGTPLNDDELDYIQQHYSDYVYKKAMDSFH